MGSGRSGNGLLWIVSGLQLQGERTGHLKDLMPGQEYRFTYEEVNGINVLDRAAGAIGQNR